MKNKPQLSVQDVTHLFLENDYSSPAAPPVAVGNNTSPVIGGYGHHGDSGVQQTTQYSPMDAWKSTERQMCVAIEGMRYAIEEMRDYAECGQAYMNGSASYPEGMDMKQYTGSVTARMEEVKQMMESYMEMCGSKK